MLTALGFLFFENVLKIEKWIFLVPCVVGWSGYVILRLLKSPGLLETWGLGLKNVRKATPPFLIFFLAALAGLAAFRLFMGWKPLPAGALWIFLLYPIWAFVQQFVLQALVATNLERIGTPRRWVIPIAALLFGLAHLPDWRLAGLCAVAGLAWTFLFLRTRSLYPAALTHAWIGALAYYWLLERDPWLEMIPAA